MSEAATIAPASEVGLTVLLPPHLTLNFETVDRALLKEYGTSPGVEALVRLWVACATSSRVQHEFENAVFDLAHKTLTPPENGVFDEKCI